MVLPDGLHLTSHVISCCVLAGDVHLYAQLYAVQQCVGVLHTLSVLVYLHVLAPRSSSTSCWCSHDVSDGVTHALYLCISVSLYLCILLAVGLELLIFFSVVMYSPLTSSTSRIDTVVHLTVCCTLYCTMDPWCTRTEQVFYWYTSTCTGIISGSTELTTMHAGIYVTQLTPLITSTEYLCLAKESNCTEKVFGQ